MVQVLGSVGEPINAEAWLWYYKQIGHGKCSIADTFFQTETGGHVITPLPGATPMKPGSAVSRLSPLNLLFIQSSKWVVQKDLIPELFSDVSVLWCFARTS